MAPVMKNTKVSTTENSVTDENLHVTRKRTRSSTTTTATKEQTTAAPEKKVNKKKDKEEGTSAVANQDIVDSLDISFTDNKKNDHVEEPVVVKRKRGRPPNGPNAISKKKEVKAIDPSAPKRGRGRPRKVVSA